MLLQGAVVAAQTDRACLRQIIEQRGGAVEEQRQVVFDTARRHALADIGIDAAAVNVAGETRAVAFPEVLDSALVERHFTRRQQANGLDLVAGALGIWVEQADAVDLVIEQVDTKRRALPHREDIQDGAAHRVFTMVINLTHGRITGRCQTAALLFQIKPLALFDEQGALAKVILRRQTLHQTRRRCHDHAAVHLAKLIKQAKPFGNQLLMRRIQVVGQGFRVRKMNHLQPIGIEAQRLFQTIGVLLVSRHDQQRSAAALGCITQPGRQTVNRVTAVIRRRGVGTHESI